MKKTYLLFLASAALMVSTIQLSAQCSGNRYHDYIFPANPTVTSGIVYGSNLKSTGATQSLLLDVYQPAGGDTSNARALVIVCHGGSFIGGSKTGTDVVPLCKDFARMGYVTASIEYRIGMTNFPFGAHTVDSADAGAAVMRAVHDGRAAIRYFRKNAKVGGNTYKIDTNNIYFAGVSAGGFVALHIAYMDLLSEFPSYVDTTGVTVGSSTGQPGMHGGLEGNSGNPGYSSKVKAIVNICGALGDTAWMSTGDTPLLSFHGTADGTVPYGSALIYLGGTYPLLQVDGSSSVAAQANNLGIENCMITWLGQDHVPEVGTSTAALAYYDSTITISRNFLEHFTCGVPLNCNYTATPMVGIHEIASDADFLIYPNPTYNNATIDLSAFKGNTVNITLYDALGREVKNIVDVKTNTYTLERGNLISGIYFMNVLVDGKKYSKKIIFE
jgi:para-nitrobenzyl esterase